MWNTLSLVKEIIIWSLPFYFLHLYISNIYNISLGKLLIWWIKNYSSTESSTAILVSFVLIFLIFCMPLTGLINSFYLGIFGEKQELIYLGNSSAKKSMYYNRYDNSKTSFTGQNIAKEYNFDFKSINTLKQFVKDPGTTKLVGQEKVKLHPTAIISTFFFTIFFLIPTLGATHALVYPMYTDIYGEQAYLQGSAITAFETLLSSFKISKGMSAIITFTALVIAIFFTRLIPSDMNNSRFSQLPTHIQQGNEITGVPVEMNIQYHRTTNNSGSSTTYDSGIRDVIYRFDKGFNPPVYVTLSFDKENYPKLDKKIESHIDMQIMMTLKIDKDLGLVPKQ